MKTLLANARTNSTRIRRHWHFLSSAVALSEEVTTLMNQNDLLTIAFHLNHLSDGDGSVDEALSVEVILIAEMIEIQASEEIMDDSRSRPRF